MLVLENLLQDGQDLQAHPFVGICRLRTGAGLGVNLSESVVVLGRGLTQGPYVGDLQVLEKLEEA